MAIESIALIPSGYKATKVYSQLPVDGGGDFTFDRGASTTQTRVNKDGLIEDVDLDVPRLDYLDGGCPSLLLEPASTNLITYSEGFNNWASVFTTVSLNEVVSPDGSVNATKLTDTSNSSTHRIQIGNTTSSSGSFCYSIFLKKGTLTTVALSVYSGADAADSKFDLDNGSIVSTTNGTAEIQDYGNDWYRCIVKGTLASTSTTVYIYLKEKASYSGSSQFLYAWGAQLEQQSYATSYVPSLGTSGVRAAETCNGAGTTDEINSQEGVLFVEAKKIAQTGTSMSIVLSDNTLNNRVQIIFHNSDTFRIFWDSSTASSYVGSTSLLDYDSYKRLALKYSSSEISLYLNGLLVSKSLGDYSFTSNTLNNLSFNISSGAENFYGRVKKLSVYDSALTDSQLEALTGFGSFAEMKSYLSYS